MYSPELILFFVPFLFNVLVNGLSRDLVDFADTENFYLSALQKFVCCRPPNVYIFHELF